MVILDAMISISSKIRLDAMSKVISFSISDKYLEKLRTLYPDSTDNLAVKQFVTDRLDEGLSNSLDASLDDRLDGRVKTLVESWVDGLLDERLDATVGKLIGDLSERLARLESRLDDGLDGNLDDGLDDMEPLLKLQREASIADHSPLPTGEPSPDEPNAIVPPDEPNAIEPAIETAIEDTLGTGSETEISDSRTSATKEKGLTDSELARLLKIDKSNITRWKQKGHPTPKYQNQWELRGRFWHEID